MLCGYVQLQGKATAYFVILPFYSKLMTALPTLSPFIKPRNDSPLSRPLYTCSLGVYNSPLAMAAGTKS